MKALEFLRRIKTLSNIGSSVLTNGDLEKLFPDEPLRTVETSIQRLVASELLERIARGVYLNPSAGRVGGRLLEEVAKALRPGATCYLSLESMLAEYGAISQIPVDRITVMTTGREGLIKTKYGTIEYTHTKRTRASIVAETLVADGRPLRIAPMAVALRDLIRVGRNVNMVDPAFLAPADSDRNDRNNHHHRADHDAEHPQKNRSRPRMR